MAVSTSDRAIRFILRELIGEVLFFPVWWYSIGFITFLRSLYRSWRDIAYRLAIKILFKNMLRPMYADYSRSGRIISFFFRIVLLVSRLVVLFVWTVLELVLVGLWIVGPLLAAALLVRQTVPL